MSTQNSVDSLKIVVYYDYLCTNFETSKRLYEIVTKSNKFEKNIQEIIFPVIQEMHTMPTQKIY